MKFFFEKCTTFLFIHILNTLPLANKFHNLPRRCPAQVLFVSEKFSNFAISRITQIIFMKNIFYQAPELQLFAVATERGFAQTSNVEDPVIKPDQDW